MLFSVNHLCPTVDLFDRHHISTRYLFIAFASEVAGRPLGQPARFTIESFHLHDVVRFPGLVVELGAAAVEPDGDHEGAAFQRLNPVLFVHAFRFPWAEVEVNGPVRVRRHLVHLVARREGLTGFRHRAIRRIVDRHRPEELRRDASR